MNHYKRRTQKQFELEERNIPTVIETGNSSHVKRRRFSVMLIWQSGIECLMPGGRKGNKEHGIWKLYPLVML